MATQTVVECKGVEVNMKETLMEYLDWLLVDKGGNTRFALIERKGFEEWAEMKKIEFQNDELGTALTELVREEKLAIYMGKEGRIFFAPPGIDIS